ncbi:MAG: hypothetical protein ACOCXG_01005 [Nanoarchaeota archaeon]
MVQTLEVEIQEMTAEMQETSEELCSFLDRWNITYEIKEENVLAIHGKPIVINSLLKAFNRQYVNNKHHELYHRDHKGIPQRLRNSITYSQTHHNHERFLGETHFGEIKLYFFK